MPEEASEDRTWLLEPPGTGIARIHVELGDGVELTDEQRGAIDSLVTAFYESEVEGFMARCMPRTCQGYSSMPCAMKESCDVLSCEIAGMTGMDFLR